MEVEFWLDSKSSIEKDGLYTPYRVLADIPDPFGIVIYNDLTGKKINFTALPAADQYAILKELNDRNKEYLSWSDKMAKCLSEIASDYEELKELNETRGLK